MLAASAIGSQGPGNGGVRPLHALVLTTGATTMTVDPPDAVLTSARFAGLSNDGVSYGASGDYAVGRALLGVDVARITYYGEAGLDNGRSDDLSDTQYLVTASYASGVVFGVRAGVLFAPNCTTWSHAGRVVIAGSDVSAVNQTFASSRASADAERRQRLPAVPRIQHMPNWKSISLPGAPPPKGPYSPAVRAGGFVYVSGQTPRDPVSGALVGNDVAAQTRQTLNNVQRLLAEAGASMSDVVSVIIYLTDVDDWATMNSVYTEFFSTPYPSRTAVGVALRDILVEISAVAYVGP